MKAFICTALIASFALPGVAAAQGDQSASTQNPISTALRDMQKRYERNLIGSAKEMPASKYGFKPTRAQMSFRRLMVHVAGSNVFMCSTISGRQAPERPKVDSTASKAQLVKLLQQSFDYCTSALANVDDSNLAETVPFFGGRTISRGGAMMDLAADWADHYGAAAIYLRLNGLLPPSARRGEAEGM